MHGQQEGARALRRAPPFATAAPPPPRPRKRKTKDEEWVEPSESFDDEDSGDKEPFDADGLSLVREEDLEGNEDADTPELK